MGRQPLSKEHHERIEQLYENTELSMKAIAAEIGCSECTVNVYVRETYSDEWRRERTAMLLSKRKNHTRKDGKLVGRNGYERCDAPSWYQGYLVNDRYADKHLVVWCEANGCKRVPFGYEVHHIDHNRTNNDPANLELLTVSEHRRLHANRRHRR